MRVESPFDIATCMYYTGLDPFTKKPVQTAKNYRPQDAAALMQSLKPGNYFEVRDALIKSGRAALSGSPPSRRGL